MYTLTVDGSFCSSIQRGGVGGYLLDENLSYKDHFHYSLKSKVCEKYFELLAIIAGMNLCLSHNQKQLHVQSDELHLINTINNSLLFDSEKWSIQLTKNIKDNDFKYFLLLKILELTKKFTIIKFSVYKCRHAHDLSRVYLGHKNYDKIVSQLKKITINKPSYQIEGAPNLNNQVTISIVKNKFKSKIKTESLKIKKLESKKLKENINEQYFLDLPLAKNIYIYPSKSTANKELKGHINILLIYNDINNHLELFKDELKIASFENRGNHLIPLINYCIAFIAKKYTNNKLHINFKNISKEYTKYLWSEKRIDLDYVSSFKVLIKMLNQHNCQRVSFTI